MYSKPSTMQTYKAYGLGRISKMELECTLKNLGMSLAPRGLHLEGEDGRFNAFVNCHPSVDAGTVKQRLRSIGARHVKTLDSYNAPTESKKGNVLLLIVVAYDETMSTEEMLLQVEGIETFTMEYIKTQTGRQPKSVCAYNHAGTMCKFGIEMQNADDANAVLAAGLFDALWYNRTLMYSLQKTKKQIHYKTVTPEVPPPVATPQAVEIPEDIQLLLAQCA